MATPTLQPTETAGEGWEEFLELETKVRRVAEALSAARAERDQLEAALKPLQAAHEKLQHAHAQAEQELVALRKERNEIRQRVARISKQLEAAEK